MIGPKRFQQGIFEALASQNRGMGSGGGSGLFDLFRQAGNAAAGNQGGYSTANSGTFADITNTSFALLVPRPSTFVYFVYVAAHITAGAATGYVRGNIVGFDTSASLLFNSSSITNGTMMYWPTSKGPIQPGSYTVKMQAATDASTTTINVDQFFHVVFLTG